MTPTPKISPRLPPKKNKSEMEAQNFWGRVRCGRKFLFSSFPHFRKVYLSYVCVALVDEYKIECILRISIRFSYYHFEIPRSFISGESLFRIGEIPIRISRLLIETLTWISRLLTETLTWISRLLIETLTWIYRLLIEAPNLPT